MAKRGTKKETGQVALDASKRIVLLHGKEAFLRTHYTDQLRETLETEHGAVDVIRIDGGETGVGIGDVLEACQSFGLMASHQLVVVDNADQVVRESARAAMERYAESPCDSATLVLRCEKWHKGNLDKLIDAVGAIVKCEEILPMQAVNWVVARASKRHDASFDRDAAVTLVDRVGVDLNRLDSEVAKLVAGLVEGESVDTARVASMVGRTREEEVWGIQRVLLGGDASSALSALRDMLDVSRHDPVLVSFACMDLARKLHGVSVGIEGGQSAQSVAGSLRIWPREAAAAIGDRAQRMGSERTRELVDRAIGVDVALKSGLGDQVRQLERLALAFVGVG